MNKDYLGTIQKYEFLGTGMYSDVYHCDYLETTFAYKELKDEEYKSLIKEKLEELCKFYGDTDCLFPYKLIYKRPDSQLFEGYVMDYLYNYITLEKELTNIDKIKLLQKGREIIEKVHNKYGYIHGDIRPANFMYNIERNDLKIIDFDNSINIENPGKVDLNYYDEYARFYINKIGINKDLDMFLFNLSCFAIINDIPYENTLELIIQNNFKNISNKKAIEVLKSYKDLNTKTLKKEYIIDYL